jgi:hypothetical protein
MFLMPKPDWNCFDKRMCMSRARSSFKGTTMVLSDFVLALTVAVREEEEVEDTVGQLVAIKSRNGGVIFIILEVGSNNPSNTGWWMTSIIDGRSSGLADNIR